MNILCVRAKDRDSIINKAIDSFFSQKKDHNLLSTNIDVQKPMAAVQHIQETIQSNRIDLIIANGYSSFYVLSMPSNICKILVNPVIDPKKSGELNLLNMVFLSNEDKKIIKQIRRKVLYGISTKNKKNVYGIFLNKEKRINQLTLFENKYAISNKLNMFVVSNMSEWEKQKEESPLNDIIALACEYFSISDCIK